MKCLVIFLLICSNVCLSLARAPEREGEKPCESAAAQWLWRESANLPETPSAAGRKLTFTAVCQSYAPVVDSSVCIESKNGFLPAETARARNPFPFLSLASPTLRDLSGRNSRGAFLQGPHSPLTCVCQSLAMLDRLPADLLERVVDAMSHSIWTRKATLDRLGLVSTSYRRATASISAEVVCVDRASATSILKSGRRPGAGK